MDKNLQENIKIVSEAWKILGNLKLVDTIFNHITFLVADESKGFKIIMNPSGFLPTEGNPEKFCVFPLKKYSSSDAADLGVNPDGLQLHSQMHLIRKKQGAIIHTHSPFTIAVSCHKHGLLPLSQTAIEFVGDIKMIKYGGVFRSNNLTKQLRQLAMEGGTALLRHHGVLIVSETIEEAIYLAYYIEEACKIQVLTLSNGNSFLVPKKPSIKSAQQFLKRDRLIAAQEFFKAFQRQL